jgi:hypothetical protein
VQANNESNSDRAGWIKIFLMYFALAIVIGVPLSLLNGFWPKNITGWVIIVLLGFPLLLFCEYLGEKLFSMKISIALDTSRKDKIISLRRMAYAMIVYIILIIIITLFVYFFRENIGNYFVVI